MQLSTKILGYSFSATKGSHIYEDPNGWTIFIVIDASKEVEFYSAYNDEIGYVTAAVYGDVVSSSDREALREFKREYKSFLK